MLPADVPGLAFTGTRHSERLAIYGFRIDEGHERVAANSLLVLINSGYEVSLRNDLDEGLEGGTDFRRTSVGYERLVGGHGWQSGWKPIGEADVIAEIVSLAPFSRDPYPSGSLSRPRV